MDENGTGATSRQKLESIDLMELVQGDPVADVCSVSAQIALLVIPRETRDLTRDEKLKLH